MIFLIDMMMKQSNKNVAEHDRNIRKIYTKDCFFNTTNMNTVLFLSDNLLKQISKRLISLNIILSIPAKLTIHF
jgi:hypothetical protein